MTKDNEARAREMWARYDLRIGDNGQMPIGAEVDELLYEAIAQALDEAERRGMERVMLQAIDSKLDLFAAAHHVISESGKRHDNKQCFLAGIRWLRAEIERRLGEHREPKTPKQDAIDFDREFKKAITS